MQENQPNHKISSDSGVTNGSGSQGSGASKPGKQPDGGPSVTAVF
jgi:hypothetical protein